MNVGDLVRVTKRIYGDVPVGTEGIVAGIDYSHNGCGFNMLRLTGPKHTAFWEYEVELVKAGPVAWEPFGGFA